MLEGPDGQKHLNIDKTFVISRVLEPRQRNRFDARSPRPSIRPPNPSKAVTQQQLLLWVTRQDRRGDRLSADTSDPHQTPPPFAGSTLSAAPLEIHFLWKAEERGGNPIWERGAVCLDPSPLPH